MNAYVFDSVWVRAVAEGKYAIVDIAIVDIRIKVIKVAIVLFFIFCIFFLFPIIFCWFR